MLLRISHLTSYSYASPASYALQRLRLTPQDGPTQRVVSWQSAVEGAKVEARYGDHFGNLVELVSIAGQAHEIRIMASGIIETIDTAGVVGPHRGFMPLWLYRRETVLTRPGKAIRELARGHDRGSALDRLHGLKSAIHAAMRFVPGETHAETAGEDALAAGVGVCQDHAHVFLAAARTMGFPARYVSGYLYMDGQTEQVASHAWAEAHVDDLGWVGFDAANDISPDGRYVQIAYGLDYRDAAPVSGFQTGAAGEALSVSITVEQ
jgi:Transglutaminase-like enzymes, putative cysteine proteases